MVFGGSDDKDKDGSKKPAESVEPAVDAGSELGVSGVSASWTKDYDGMPCIVVSYQWTNNGEENASAGVKLDISAYQNGVELGMAISPESGHDSGSSLLDLKPGATATVTKAWQLSDTSSVVEVEFTRMFRDEPKLAMEFDPAEGGFVAASSGGQDAPPATDSAADPATGIDGQDPAEKLPDGAGYVNGHYVEAKSAFMTTDYEGGPVIVVTFSWTNNGDEAYSSMSQVMAKAFQGGVELENAIGVSNRDMFDPEPYMLEIKPGASIDVQRAFLVRDMGSSVEFEIGTLFGTGDPVVKTFVPSELEQY